MKIYLGLLFAIFPFATQAASHYIRSGATGTSCVDWGANACNALPSTLIRDDTYYIASGTYAGRTFNTPTLGTTLITIKGATAPDHGTDVGWNDLYSVDVNSAIWTSNITFSTSYWVFDGSVGPKWSKNPDDYGFKFTSNLANPVTVGGTGQNTSDFKISHVAATAPAGDIEKVFLITGNPSGETDNVTISYSYFNGWQNVYMASSPLSGTHYQDNWLFEYNISLNGFSSPAHHGEDINNNWGIMYNQITRFNWFEGRSEGTGIIVANNADNINAKIYGNVFANLGSGNGIITGTSAGDLISPQIYNNTFLNCSTGGGWVGTNTTGAPTISNNLLYNMSAAKSADGGDYNAYFNTTNAPQEAHGQIGSGSPFKSLSMNDLHLAGPTLSGLALSSPFNIDPDGKLRGSEGNWDRGAFEYSSTSQPLTFAAPMNLRIVQGP